MPDRHRTADEVPHDPALLDLATELAQAAGQLALRGRRSARHGSNDTPASTTKSSSTDLVTEFDRAAESLIVEGLARWRPDDAVVGEEGTSLPGTSGYSWLIDPIDGTTNFVYDLPSWCTSIAVAFRGHTVAGVVYVPITDELYQARLGGGATLNGHPCRVSDRSQLDLALVATGFAYEPATRERQAARVARMITSIRDVRRLGSAAIDLCHVASGRVDAYFEEHLNAWDAAAGELIACEAGATATDFAGGASRPEQLVVSTPAIHHSLLDLIAQPER
jgi:myo-inositol-1(or 4)-monophosphatase